MGKLPQPDGATGYRISELVESAGVSRDMIKYYLRAGLLPPAHKPRANLSLYTENHLKLIQLIRKFQEQTKLSLPAIADVFQSAGYDANAIDIELLSAGYSASDNSNIIPLKENPDQLHSLDFPADFLEQLSTTTLLQATDQPEQDEEQILGLLWAAHQAGVPLSFFATAREKIAELADLEVKTLIAIKRPDLNFGAMVENVTDVNRIISRWMVAEKSRQIRSQFQRVIENSERAIVTLLDTVYRPSNIFWERHGLRQQLAELNANQQGRTLTAAQGEALCMVYMLLGEYQEVIAAARQTLTGIPGEPLGTAYMALANGLKNEVDLAFDFGSQLEHSSNKHPVILQARMLSMLLKASKMSGVADTNELMKGAGEIFLELLQDPAKEEPEAILTLARANVAFPDFANSRPQAVAALQRLLGQIDNDTIDLGTLPEPAMRPCLVTVYRISTLYYLGMLHKMDGDPTQAAIFLKQVIQLDPASNLGNRAYLQLGADDEHK